MSENMRLLADGGLEELVPLLIFVGISVVGAIIRASKGSDAEEKQNESTQKLIEMAKRYKAMKETGREPDVPKETLPYARTATEADRKPATLSEWDRRQREKKQQVQQRQTRLDRPRYVPEKQKTPVANPPEEIPVAFAVPQAKPVRRPKMRPQIPQKGRPKRATQQTIKKPVAIPTAYPVAKSAKAGKRHEPVKRKTETTMPAGTSLKSLLKKPKSLRTAILLKEILDKPIALRDF